MWQAAAGAAAGQAAGSALSGMIDFGFGALASAQAYKRQKKILKNQIQWRVDDMRAAGLNPILAVSPGAGSSSGSVAMGATGRSKIDLVQSLQQLASAKALDAQGEKAHEEAETARQLRQPLVEAEFGRNLMYTGEGARSMAQAQLTQTQRDLARATLPYQVSSAKALEGLQKSWIGGPSKKWEEMRRRLFGSTGASVHGGVGAYRSRAVNTLIKRGR